MSREGQERWTYLGRGFAKKRYRKHVIFNTQLHNLSGIPGHWKEIDAVGPDPRFEFRMCGNGGFVSLCHKAFTQGYVRLDIAARADCQAGDVQRLRWLESNDRG